jgi:hypothetical protein
MIKHNVDSTRLVSRLTMIAATLSALAGTTLANPCPVHRHKPAVAFYQQSTNSNTGSVNVRHRQAIESDSTRYEPPYRPGFDADLR